MIDWWKGDGSLIDFFNPNAVRWWHRQMDNAIELGIDGWKCDGIDPQIIYAEHGRPKDAFIRWAQLGSFSPVMENGGDGEHRPWMFDEETATIYRDFVELHYRLIPYMMKHGANAFEDGESLTMYLRKEDYSYLLGPDVFVAPMLEEGTTRTVAFPEETWIYLFDADKEFVAGTETTLDIPLHEFPAFVRKGSDLDREMLPP